MNSEEILVLLATLSTGAIMAIAYNLKQISKSFKYLVGDSLPNVQKTRFSVSSIATILSQIRDKL